MKVVVHRVQGNFDFCSDDKTVRPYSEFLTVCRHVLFSTLSGNCDACFCVLPKWVTYVASHTTSRSRLDHYRLVSLPSSLTLVVGLGIYQDEHSTLTHFAIIMNKKKKTERRRRKNRNGYVMGEFPVAVSNFVTIAKCSRSRRGVYTIPP